MNELLDRIVANVGIDRSTAETAIGIILTFLLKEGSSDDVQALIDRTPGADAAAKAAIERSGGVSDVGADVAGSGSSISGAGEGIMGVGMRLMATGMSLGEIQDITHELLAHARVTVGHEATERIVGSIPGLDAFA